MSEEQLTPEEAEALEAMESQPVDEKAEEPKAEEPKAEPEARPDEPEFKSVRTEDKPPEGFVPHQAMHAEREKRKAVEARLEALEKAMEKPAEAAPEYVDPLEDPEGFRKWAEYNRNGTQERLDQQDRQFKQQQEHQQRVQELARSEAEFSAKTPDYPDALKHLEATRLAELQGMGYGQQEALAQMQKDAQGILQAAKSMNMNPAELAYFHAQRAGYKKVEVTPDPTEAEKMAALSKAQENTEGLNSSGAPQSGQLTVKALSEMSEEELAAIPDADFKKVMGG